MNVLYLQAYMDFCRFWSIVPSPDGLHKFRDDRERYRASLSVNSTVTVWPLCG